MVGSLERMCLMVATPSLCFSFGCGDGLGALVAPFLWCVTHTTTNA